MNHKKMKLHLIYMLLLNIQNNEEIKLESIKKPLTFNGLGLLITN